MEQLVARPALMAYSTTFSFSTGRAPGKPKQTGQVCELGWEPKRVEQPQNILVLVVSWVCTSSPMTTWYFIDELPKNKTVCHGENLSKSEKGIKPKTSFLVKPHPDCGFGYSFAPLLRIGKF